MSGLTLWLTLFPICTLLDHIHKQNVSTNTEFAICEQLQMRSTQDEPEPIFQDYMNIGNLIQGNQPRQSYPVKH